MAYEKTQEVRKAKILADGRYEFTVHEVQVYDVENVNNMLAQWRKKNEEYDRWLADFDKHVEMARDAAAQELGAMREKILADKASIEEGLRIWENAERDSTA